MPLPKFGMLTNSSSEILKEINTIAKLGFDYVEIGIEWPESMPNILMKKKEKILKLLKKWDIFAIGHTAWWINFGSQYESVRKAWIFEAKNKIDVAKTLRMKQINFHFFSDELNLGIDKNYKRAVLFTMIKSLKEIVTYASSKNIEVILENVPRKRRIIGINEFKFVQHNVPGLGMHLDVPHAFIENGMKGIREYISTFSKDIKHIHMHDNHGEWDEHLPIGMGKINFAEVVKMLKAIGYNDTITLEVFTSKQDAVKSREKIKRLWIEK